MIKFTPLLITAFVALFYFGLVDNARGPTYPQLLNSFNLSPSTGSFIYALSSFFGVIVTVFASYWLPKLHLRAAISFGGLLIGISSLLLALAHQVDSFYLALFSSAVLGIGMGFCSIAMNLIVEHESSESSRRQTFSALHTTYGISSFCSPLLYSFLLTMGMSRWSYYYIALAPLCLFIFLLPKKDHVVFASTEDTEGNEQANSKLPLSILAAICLCVGTYVASEIAISSRIVLFLKEYYQQSQVEANTVLSLFFLLLTLGRLSLALYSWQISSLTLMIGSLLSTQLLCILGLWKYPYAFAFTGFTMSVFFPSIMDWLGQVFPKDFTKVNSYALTGIGIHLVFMHLGFGKLATMLGVFHAMFLPIGLSVLSLSMLVLLVWWQRCHIKESL